MMVPVWGSPPRVQHVCVWWDLFPTARVPPGYHQVTSAPGNVDGQLCSEGTGGGALGGRRGTWREAGRLEGGGALETWTANYFQHTTSASLPMPARV